MKKVTQKELRDAYDSLSYSMGTWKGRHRSDNHAQMIAHVSVSLAPLLALLERPMRKTVGPLEGSALSLAKQARQAIGEHKGSRVTRVKGGDVETSCYLSSSEALRKGGFLVCFRPFDGPSVYRILYSPELEHEAVEHHDRLVKDLS